MKQVNLFIAFLCCIILCITSSCVSLTGFNSGRTVPKGGGEFGANLTVVETVDYGEDTSYVNVPTFYVPVIELGGRYGILDRLDVGLRVSSTLNILLDAKYQFVGTQDSPLAMSIGGGVGFTSLAAIGVTVFNFQVPLSVSFHPRDNLHVYVTPRYIYQTAGQVSKVFGSSNYTGFNAGVMFGREFKFGFDFGNYRLRGDGGQTGLNYDRRNLINIGMGMSYTFGGGKKSTESTSY